MIRGDLRCILLVLVIHGKEAIEMITYVRLKNFKSFRDTLFDFRKGKNGYKKFVAIYGENGSGKSNFVDSLSFLRFSLESFRMVIQAEKLRQMQETVTIPEPFATAFASGDFFAALDFRGFMADHRMIDCDEETTIEIGFIYNNHSGNYLLSFKEGFVREKLYYFTGKQRGVMFDISYNGNRIVTSFCGNFFKTRQAEAELKNLIDQYWGKHSLLSILNREREEKNADYIQGSFLEYVFEPIQMIMYLTAKHSIGSFQKQESNVNYKGVIANPMEGRVVAEQEKNLNQTERILNDFFTQAYSDIKRVYYIKESEGVGLHYKLFADKMIGGQIRSIGFSEESEGTKRLLFMINDLLGACQGGTIAFDEIDTGIHDLLLKTVLSSMGEWINGQLIITTHNTYLLETMRPQSIYVINVDYLGNKEVHCLDEYEIHGTNNVRNMYIKGLFGGVPVVDEIEYGEIVEELKETNSEQEGMK